MASLIGAVVGSLLGSAVKIAADLLLNFGQGKLNLLAESEADIGEIKRNMELMLAQQQQQLLQEVIHPCKEKKISFEHMVDLAYDIEDCLDRIQRHGVGWRSAPLYDEVQKLKKRLEKAHIWKENNNGNPSHCTTTSLPQADVKLVGIDKPKKEILDLLDDIEGQQEQTTKKIICIVGFSGTGKSTLAEKVFSSEYVESRFPCRGKVIASQYKDKAGELFMALMQQINPDETDHEKNITDYLKNKRYFIVLDDIINMAQWSDVSANFPDTTGAVIIVTTKDQTVAIACRNGGSNGFLYNMRTLNDTHSSDEYIGDFFERDNKIMFEEGFRLFANKCDGHQLSLACMTTYLRGQRGFTKENFCTFWNNLGDSMKDEVFRKLKQILVDSYRTLDSNDVRAFLLYLCLFPNGHPIRRERLTRRWLAEGYSTQQDSYLQNLVDKNVVRTLELSKDLLTVKCCRVHGIIHGFLVHMSKPAKFIAPDGSAVNIDRGKYRHLCFEGGESEKPDVGPSVNSQDNSSFQAHSLTICGTAGKNVIGDLPKCEVLRVLDLEECDDLESDDIKELDKLWHLKYLSLGPNIDKLPEKLNMLHCLEMLDLRKTKIDTIPMAVIELHHLAHLLGKFKLEKKCKVDKFFKKGSNLETLAGFVTDGNPGFPMLMVHMKKLNRVKIWCDSVGKDSVGFNALSEAIKMFVEARLDRCRGDHSLSLYLRHSSEGILSSVWKDGEIVTGYLTSLKLHGALLGLTKFVRLLCGLKELCLSSTNGLTKNELTNLHMLKELKYLKLVNVNLADFEIKRLHFRQLLRLCLVNCHRIVPTIGEEALPHLHSLWILNKELDGLSDINIKQHKHLQEVALDTNVKQATITSWEEAVKKHPNRPKVLFFECVKSNETGSMVKCVATERPVARRPGKRPGISCESISVEQQLSSDFNKRLKCDGDANLEESVASASIELHGAMDIDVECSSRVMMT